MGDNCFEQAYTNIKQFVEDSGVPLFIISANMTPEEDDYYSFTLRTVIDGTYSREWEVSMPSLPLEQVRYKEGQNAWDFKRLYIDGSSWLWHYALITKEDIINELKESIDVLQSKIEQNKSLIGKIEKLP